MKRNNNSNNNFKVMVKKILLLLLMIGVFICSSFCNAFQPADLLSGVPVNHIRSSRRSFVAIAIGGPAAVAIQGEVASAASMQPIDANNAVAREFTAFPGLYPTIASKIVKSAKIEPFRIKADVYAALDSDVESKRLKNYECFLLINHPNIAVKKFKKSQICKCECKGGISISYEMYQIKAVQSARR